MATGSWGAEVVFHSSGTGSDAVSKHPIKDLSVYRNAFVNGFKGAYGNPESYILLCLLPNYTDNPHSSLIFMTDELIRLSGHRLSGYYLSQDDALCQALKAGVASDRKVLLLGVS
ncbi:MAG TPA: acyl transferase, partial [Nitrospinaceae bacterium]|nr:acyl transferase [Nitrospinaceae bacterium]